MESPIQFDDQFWIQAGKIGYVWTDRMLPAKFEPRELPIPQLLPKQLFRLGELTAQLIMQ